MPVKRTLLLLTLLIAVCAGPAVSQSDAQFSLDRSPLPAPTGFVNDYVGVIDPGAKQQLEQKLTSLRDRTGVEIGVAVVGTTGGRPIFDYSLAVARGWGIGSKADDNPSALLFVAIDDRQYFTQISKDLEDELPDGVAGSLQRQYLVPEFRRQNYSKGISDTVDAYIRRIEETRAGIAPTVGDTERPRSRTRGSGGLFGVLCCLVIAGIILLMIFGRGGGGGGRRGRRGGDWGGGFGSALPWIIASAIANSGSHSSGSSWGGGSSDWGGGGGWGGFGGGGDFGGGGAGGGW